MEERLQKFLAKSGIASRRESEEIIKEGRVSVNGKVIKEMGYIVSNVDTVLVDGLEVKPIEDKVYYMLNKPTGYLTTMKDDRGRKTVASLIDGIDERVFPIGRLDYDTSGLILFTNDGDFSNLLLNPKTGIEKEYLVTVKGLLRKNESSIISKGGIILDGTPSKPVKIYNVEYNKERTSTTLQIVLTEGKNREIRRLFDYVGHEVSSIKRIRFGNITLDVKKGTYRRLKPFEIKSIKLLAINGKPKEKKVVHRTTSIRVKRKLEEERKQKALSNADIKN